MNAMPPPDGAASNASYEVTRFNALQHGVLSRHAVMPWEDRNEYQTLLDALVEEHVPNGPTEVHLVEELAGIFWGERCYQPTAEMLETWLRRHRKEFYEDAIVELEHRDAIREQAFGAAYGAKRLEVTARYEVHLVWTTTN
jgi:hypothetical protein